MTDSPPATVTALNPPGLAPTAGYAPVVAATGSRLVFLSGQAASDADGNLVGKRDFAAQAAQVFANLATALKAAGCDARHVVKLTVFVRDMGDLAAYRAARDRFFDICRPRGAPAVTLVEVSRLFDDDYLIEIDAVAVC